MANKKLGQEPKTPWNPSRSASARVKNPIPAPKSCPYCPSTDITIKENSAVYGRTYGEWPWIYICLGCSAYVGMHPYTNIPLGTLADKSTREARKRSKDVFHNAMNKLGFSRGDMYAALANEMGISVGECHFGWFNVAQCNQAQKCVEAMIAPKPSISQATINTIQRLKDLLKR